MPLFWKITIGVVLTLLVAAFVGLSLMAGSPKDAYGMVRYALPRSEEHTSELQSLV